MEQKNANYSVKIVDSSRTLTARERIRMKDTTNAIKLDEVCAPDSPMVITPTGYAVLGIHNEASDDVDYNNYVIEDESGNKYVTGSGSFWESFKEIWDEMSEEDEPYSIEVYKVESKNYKGKHFLTCSII